MEKFKIILEENPAKSDIKFLRDRLVEYNLAQTKVYDDKDLAIFIRDGHNQILGGLYGMSWGSWLEISYLWIREDLRKRVTVKNCWRWLKLKGKPGDVNGFC